MTVRLLWAALATFTTVNMALVIWSGREGLLDAAALLWYLGMLPALIAAGAVLLWKRPNNSIGHLFVGAILGMFLVSGAVEGATLIVYENSGVQEWMWASLWTYNVLTASGFVLISILIALLPDGRPRFRRERRFTRFAWLALVLPIASLAYSDPVPTYEQSFVGLPEVANPIAIPGLVQYGEALYAVWNLMATVLFLGALALQIMRYRRAPIRERKQVRWVMLAVGLAGFILTIAFVLTSLDVVPSGHNVVAGLLTIIPMLLIVASIVVAVLEPPWVDIDIVIRKSFVYGALSFLILLLYVGVAATFGVAAGTRLPVEVAIVLTVVVALLFQPARQRLQLVADRWVFGARPTKYEAVAEFSETIEQASDPSELLPQLVATIERALNLEWVAAELDDGSRAETGAVGDEPEVTVPIGSADEEIGQIECGPKVQGSMDSDEIQLVQTLAGQVGLAVMNARLAGRIVNAAEAERRRIERNIHDGAQQELVALVAKLGMAKTTAQKGGLTPGELASLQTEAKHILGDLRELAQGIHPSVLTDGGILEAVEERCTHLPLPVSIEAPPEMRSQRFEDDVEGAAYFFVTESLTNILKHAEATHASVSMTSLNGDLILQVTDDGRGFEPRTTGHSGLDGLRDRIRALGGTVIVSSSPGRGTQVTARLPVTGR